VTISALFPDSKKWEEAILAPFLNVQPNLALAVMRPFAGAVFMASELITKPFPPPQRDFNGYSVPLRMAMYTADLLCHPAVLKLVPQHRDVLVSLLYWLGLTTEVAKDQVDLLENSKLFELHLNPDVMASVRDFLVRSQACLIYFVKKTPFWYRVNRSDQNWLVIDDLIQRLVRDSDYYSPFAFYAAKSLSNVLSKLLDSHGWQSADKEEWLQFYTHSLKGGLKTISFLTALQENLGTSKIVKFQCNKCISDILREAPTLSGLRALVNLNALLAVYDEDSFAPIQSRVVFAVKHILSWTEDTVTGDAQSGPKSLEDLVHGDPEYAAEICSEACRALQKLLPLISNIYGTYWEKTLAFCVSIWESNESGDLSNKLIPMIGMSLKLYSVLLYMRDKNDDLVDVLKDYSERVAHGLTSLLKLRRSKENQPLEFVDTLLLRLVAYTTSSHFKDLTEFYPLVASDFRLVQSSAYDVLHRALPLAQQEISINVLLENKGKCTTGHNSSNLLILIKMQHCPQNFCHCCSMPRPYTTFQTKY
jgi:hypothetical protein